VRLFEKHKNGAIIDMDGEPERVAQILLEWRVYQDRNTVVKLPTGFVRREDEENA
jgi:hypothetical protein